jgi:hypothetical protein
MNIWRRESLSKNPYWRTAFLVTRVPREEVRRRTIVRTIGDTRRIVAADPLAHVIGDKPVTIEEINAAEQILLNPKQRILEELLEHTSEKLPLEDVRQLAREAGAALSAQSMEQLPVTNLEGLRAWAEVLVREFLQSVPGPDPSFGALELGLVPPFGQTDEE